MMLGSQCQTVVPSGLIVDLASGTVQGEGREEGLYDFCEGVRE